MNRSVAPPRERAPDARAAVCSYRAYCRIHIHIDESITISYGSAACGRRQSSVSAPCRHGMSVASAGHPMVDRADRHPLKHGPGKVYVICCLYHYTLKNARILNIVVLRGALYPITHSSFPSSYYPKSQPDTEAQMQPPSSLPAYHSPSQGL